MKRFSTNHHYENSAGKHIVIVNRTRRYLFVLYRGAICRYLIRTDYKRGTEYVIDSTAGADYRTDYTWYADCAA